MSDKRRKFIGFVLYWGIVLFLCWIGVRYVLLWLLPFLIALGLAYLMEPSVCFLREKLRLRRGFISSVLALLLLALILAVLTVLCLNLLQQSVRLFKALPQYLAELPTYLRRSGNDWSSSVPPVPRACNPGWSVRCQMAPSS